MEKSKKKLHIFLAPIYPQCLWHRRCTPLLPSPSLPLPNPPSALPHPHSQAPPLTPSQPLALSPAPSWITSRGLSSCPRETTCSQQQFSLSCFIHFCLLTGTFPLAHKYHFSHKKNKQTNSLYLTSPSLVPFLNSFTAKFFKSVVSPPGFHVFPSHLFLSSFWS